MIVYPHYVPNAAEIRLGGVAVARGDGPKEDCGLYGLVLRGVLQVLKIMTGKDVVIGAMVIDQNTKLPKAVRLLAPMLPGLKDTVICLDWPHTSRTMQEKQQHRFRNFAVFHPIANGQLRQMHMCKSDALLECLWELVDLFWYASSLKVSAHSRLSGRAYCHDGGLFHRRASGEADVAEWFDKELMKHEIFRGFRFNSSGTLGVPNNSNPIESHHQFLTSKQAQSGPLRLRSTREQLFYQGYPQLTRADAAKATKLIADDAVKAGCHVLGERPARDKHGHIVLPAQLVAKAASFTNADLLWSCEQKAWYCNSSAHMGKVTVDAQLVGEYERTLAGSPSASLVQHDGSRASLSAAITRLTNVSHHLHKVWWASDNDRFECDCEGYWKWVLCAHVLAIQHIHWNAMESFLPGARLFSAISPSASYRTPVVCSKNNQRQHGGLRLLQSRAFPCVGCRTVNRSHRWKHCNYEKVAEQPPRT